jgi:ABC-type antimicrobial peptide transport system permease subunit
MNWAEENLTECAKTNVSNSKNYKTNFVLEVGMALLFFVVLSHELRSAVIAHLFHFVWVVASCQLAVVVCA